MAISGLYRNLHFQVVGPIGGRPVILDDTVYSIACRTKEEATLLERLLYHESTQRFLRSLVFFDSKRPITVELLRRLDLEAIAVALGEGELFKKLFSDSPFCVLQKPQQLLFEMG